MQTVLNTLLTKTTMELVDDLIALHKQYAHLHRAGWSKNAIRIDDAIRGELARRDYERRKLRQDIEKLFHELEAKNSVRYEPPDYLVDENHRRIVEGGDAPVPDDAAKGDE